MKKFFLLALTGLLFLGLNPDINAQSITIGGGQFTSTTYGPCRTNTSDNQYNRHAYIYTSDLLDQIQNSDTIRSFEFSRTGTNAVVGNPNMMIYVANTSDTVFASPVTWATEIATMTLVYSGNPAAFIGDSDGFKAFIFDTPFVWNTANGENLKVLIEYTQDSGQTSTINWRYDNATGEPSYQNNQTRYSGGTGSPPATTTSTNQRHPMIKINFPAANNVGVTSILASQFMYQDVPNEIRALVKNSGTSNQSSFSVTAKTSSGYTSTKVLTNVASDSVVDVLFDPFIPTASGMGTLTVYTTLGSDTYPDDDTLMGDGFVYNPIQIDSIWDNGPMVNRPGLGANGYDASQLVPPMTTYGDNQIQGVVRIADDFTITHPGGWEINKIILYGYQTGGDTTVPSFTGYTLQIWDGPPNDGGTVVFGDTMTNVLDTTAMEWTEIFRVSSTSITNTQRPIWAHALTVSGITLMPGNYWLDFSASGSLASGPWVPPIVMDTLQTTGNSLRYVVADNEWAPSVDGGSGTQLGYPFQIYFDTLTVSGIAGNETPVKYELYQNYPNPFNPVTKIKYDIPKQSFVTLRIYDMLGREIRTLVNSELEPGAYSFDFDASSFASGVYFYRLTAGSFVQERKMVLLK